MKKKSKLIIGIALITVGLFALTIGIYGIWLGVLNPQGNVGALFNFIFGVCFCFFSVGILIPGITLTIQGVKK